MNEIKYRIVLNAAEQTVEKRGTAMNVARRVSSDPKVSGNMVYVMYGENVVASFLNGYEIDNNDNEEKVNEAIKKPVIEFGDRTQTFNTLYKAEQVAQKISADSRSNGKPVNVYGFEGEILYVFVDGEKTTDNKLSLSSRDKRSTYTRNLPKKDSWGNPIKESSAPTANSIGGGAMNNKVVTSPASKRRKDFARCAVFEVSGNTYDRCREALSKGKRQNFSQYLDEDDRDEIVGYAKQNPRRSIAVKDPETGAHTFLKIGSKGKF